MGTAEQNRTPGQRGQRAGIPFAAGRSAGGVSSLSVSQGSRGGEGSPWRLQAAEVETGNCLSSGTWVASGLKRTGPCMNLKNPECGVRPALSAACTPTAPRCPEARSRVESLILLLSRGQPRLSSFARIEVTEAECKPSTVLAPRPSPWARFFSKRPHLAAPPSTSTHHPGLLILF